MSKRIEQVNELVQKELGHIILREIEFPSGVLMTVTRVETSKDLENAKVYISVLPEKEKGNALDILNSQIYQIQGDLNRRLKIQPLPRIIFVEEKETVEAGKIEEILERLKKKKK